MFKSKKFYKNLIITIVSVTVCFITFLILKMAVRGNMSVASGGELFILLIPLILYVFIKNWKLFMETCFPKDTMFDDYFTEYFTGKDMFETDKSLGAEDIDYYISH